MKTFLAIKAARMGNCAGLVFFASALLLSVNHANADSITDALSPYPQTTQDFASCLMSLEIIKSEARIVGHQDAKPLELSAGLAQIFIDKAISLESRAASIDMDDDTLTEHWQSILENSKSPDLLNKMIGRLEAEGHSPELCIGLPDLVNQKELEETLDTNSLQQLAEIAAANNCSITGADAPVPVHKVASIEWTGAELLVWGGKVVETFSQSGLIYTPSTDSWAIMPQNGDVPSARWAAYSVWTGSDMIVYGGSESQFNLGSTLFNGAKYNPATSTWTAISSANAPENSNAEGAMVGNFWVLWGGNLDTGARYHINNDLWEAIGNGPESRTGFTLNATQSYQMLMYGGLKYDANNGAFEFRNDVWLYSINTNSWAQKASPPANHSDYPPRTDHTAVWSGTELLTFGGKTTGFGAVQKGARFNLASNSWSAISTSSQPSKRSAHGSAWTGSEMIIWAGVDAFVMRGGAIYNPSNNTWRGLPSGSASTRYNFYSTWTGSEYLVLSNDSGSNLKPGDIYNYADGTWRKMSTQVSDSSTEVQAMWDFDEFLPSGIPSPDGKRVVDVCGDRDAKLLTPNSPQATTAGLQSNTTAVTFDAGSDRIRFLAEEPFSDGGSLAGSAIDFDYNDSMTLEAVIRLPNNHFGLDSIVAKDVGTNQPSWWFRVANGVLQGLVSDGPNEPYVLGSTPINDGQWHHVAFVRDAALKTLSVYVDYTLDGSEVDTTLGGSLTSQDTEISIGAFNSGSRQLPGDIDFVRISKGVVPISQMHNYANLVDIAVALGDDGSPVEANTVVQYTLTATNSGPVAATNINVVQNFPADFSSIEWTCVASVSASCVAAGSGDIDETTSIPAGGSVTFTINATLSATPGSVVSTSATATTMGSEIELNTANNSATSVIYSEEIFANGFEEN